MTPNELKGLVRAFQVRDQRDLDRADRLCAEIEVMGAEAASAEHWQESCMADRASYDALATKYEKLRSALDEIRSCGNAEARRVAKAALDGA